MAVKGKAMKRPTSSGRTSSAKSFPLETPKKKLRTSYAEEAAALKKLEKEQRDKSKGEGKKKTKKEKVVSQN